MSEIIDVSVDTLDLSLRDPFEISIGTQFEASNILVTLKTESVIGQGEGAPYPPLTGETQETAISTARSMGDMIIGKNLEDYRSLIDIVRVNFPGMASAACAVETAILDAFCREHNLSLSELFGGTPKPVETDLTIPIIPPHEARSKAVKAADSSFENLKIKTGTDVDQDIQRVLAVSEEVPDANLKIDANQGWTTKETIRFANAIDEHGITLELIEQPVPRENLSALSEVRKRVKVPIAADEAVFTPADAIQVVKSGAADIINVKVGKSGLLGSADIISIANSAGIELMIGCMIESSMGVHTSAHIVAGSGAFDFVDLDGHLLLEDDPERNFGPFIDIDGPGHGMSLDR